MWLAESFHSQSTEYSPRMNKRKGWFIVMTGWWLAEDNIEDNRQWWDAGHCNMRRWNLKECCTQLWQTLPSNLAPIARVAFICNQDLHQGAHCESSGSDPQKNQPQRRFPIAVPPNTHPPTPRTERTNNYHHPLRVLSEGEGKTYGLSCKITDPSREVSSALRALHWWESFGTGSPFEIYATKKQIRFGHPYEMLGTIDDDCLLIGLFVFLNDCNSAS